MKKILIASVVTALFLSAGSLTAMAETKKAPENVGEKVQETITQDSVVVAKDAGELTNKTIEVADEVEKNSAEQLKEFEASTKPMNEQISQEAKEDWKDTETETKKLSNEVNNKIQKDL